MYNYTYDYSHTVDESSPQEFARPSLGSRHRVRPGTLTKAANRLGP